MHFCKQRSIRALIVTIHAGSNRKCRNLLPGGVLCCTSFKVQKAQVEFPFCSQLGPKTAVKHLNGARLDGNDSKDKKPEKFPSRKLPGQSKMSDVLHLT